MKPVDLETVVRGDPPRSDGLDMMWPENWTRVSVTPRTTRRGGPTDSQPTGRKRRAGGRSALRRIPDGAVHWRKISGVSHTSVPCLYQMDRIARRLVVMLWRATMWGLQMTDIP